MPRHDLFRRGVIRTLAGWVALVPFSILFLFLYPLGLIDIRDYKIIKRRLVSGEK